MQKHVLFIGEDRNILDRVRQICRQITPESFQCAQQPTCTDALACLADKPEASVILLNVPSVEGAGLIPLMRLYEQFPLLPIIVILAHPSPRSIKAAVSQGAFDFLPVPIDGDEFKATLQRAFCRIDLLSGYFPSASTLHHEILQLRKAVETMRLGVTISDLHGCILYTNPADAAMHGYEQDELLGQDARMFAPSELRQPMTVEQVRQWEGFARESENIRKDGSRFPVWLISAVIKDEDGKAIAIITSCEDISERKRIEEELTKHRYHLEELIKERTEELLQVNQDLQQEINERKHAEEALRESEQKYRLLFENLPDVFYRIDREGNFLLFSPSVTHFLGYSMEEALTLNARDVFVRQGQFEDFLSLVEAHGHLENFEVLLKRQDGSFEWGSAHARWYKNHDGEVVGYEGIIRDFSIRKQAELEILVAHDELQKTNRQLQELNASKDKFFSIISHDLRNQFTTLIGFTEIIESKIEVYNRERLKQVIGMLKNSAERLYALFENLLTWSRLQRGAMACQAETISLCTIVAENLKMIETHAEIKQITLKNEVLEDCVAYADYSMVDTVIRNLLSNALKFTGQKGLVLISSTTREREIEIVVSDTGCGIEKDVADLLFRIDSNYTSKGTAGEKGTGLGLILCQELVEKNSGQIWVESEVGKGSSFIFTLPRFLREDNHA